MGVVSPLADMAKILIGPSLLASDEFCGRGQSGCGGDKHRGFFYNFRN